MFKLALLAEGGGMRGIYGAGALDCFLKEGIVFDYCIAVSAGAANVASFLSGDYGRNYRFYAHHAKDKRYKSVGNLLKTGSFFGVEYIYDTLTNTVDPINYDVFLNTPSAFRVVVTNAKTGRAEYLNNSHFGKNNCTPLMASCSVPAMCRPYSIGKREYYDGGVSDPIPVQKAIDDGCEKIVAVLSRPRNFEKPPERMRPAYTLLLRKYPQIIRALNERHIVYKNSISKLYELERQGRAIIIAPSEEVGASMISGNEKKLNALYSLGIKDAQKALNKIKAFSNSAPV